MNLYRCMTVIAISLWAASCASASFLISIDNAVVPSAGSGTIDVNITNTTTNTLRLAGFSIDVATSGGLQFTAVNYPTTNYVFAGDSFNQNYSLPLSTNTFPNSSFTAADLSDTLVGYIDFSPGDTLKLVTISFTDPVVSSSPPDTFIVQIQSADLADEIGNLYSYTASSGTVTVTGMGPPVEVVPEPATFVAFGGCLTLGLVIRRFRRAKFSDDDPQAI